MVQNFGSETRVTSHRDWQPCCHLSWRDRTVTGAVHDWESLWGDDTKTKDSWGSTPGKSFSTPIRLAQLTREGACTQISVLARDQPQYAKELGSECPRNASVSKYWSCNLEVFGACWRNTLTARDQSFKDGQDDVLPANDISNGGSPGDFQYCQRHQVCA